MTRYLVLLVCLVSQVTVPGTATWAANIPDLKSLGDPHIVGGKEAEPHSHPYQVALLLSRRQPEFGFCGGSLLSDTWVVTAAHCTNNIKDITAVSIIVGAHRIKEQENETQTVSIEKVYQHPAYDKDEIMINDISLIRLSSPVKLNKYVQPIRLPSQKQKTWWFWNHKVTLTGWGSVSDGRFEMAPTLREVETKTTSNFVCRVAFLFRYIHDTNICASGWYSKGACRGDSGGPMAITESDGEPTLIGVTSFGIGLGCEVNWPTVCTRVTSYLDWIHSTANIPKRL